MEDYLLKTFEIACDVLGLLVGFESAFGYFALCEEMRIIWHFIFFAINMSYFVTTDDHHMLPKSILLGYIIGTSASDYYNQFTIFHCIGSLVIILNFAYEYNNQLNEYFTKWDESQRNKS